VKIIKTTRKTKTIWKTRYSFIGIYAHTWNRCYFFDINHQLGKAKRTAICWKEILCTTLRKRSVLQ